MDKTLQVYLPAPKSLIAQRFGDNANPSYAASGLKGHTAYDWALPYGAPILNCVADAYCYSLMHQNDPVLMDYRAVFFVVETETGIYEISYGHCSDFVAEVGKTYQVGDVIAHVGNTGPCYVGQHLVTEAEKDAGSHAGAHLHGPQIRPVRKVPAMRAGYDYIFDSNGQFQKDGFYYEVINYNNCYHGCVSLRNFSTEIIASDYRNTSIKNVLVATGTIATTIAQSPVAVQQTVLPAFSQLVDKIVAFFKSRGTL